MWEEMKNGSVSGCQTETGKQSCKKRYKKKNQKFKK